MIKAIALVLLDEVAQALKNIGMVIAGVIVTFIVFGIATAVLMGIFGVIGYLAALILPLYSTTPVRPELFCVFGLLIMCPITIIAWMILQIYKVCLWLRDEVKIIMNKVKERV